MFNDDLSRHLTLKCLDKWRNLLPMCKIEAVSQVRLEMPTDLFLELDGQSCWI
jgi:hypothetical protein